MLAKFFAWRANSSGMTVQLHIDCSGIVLPISGEFSHNLFHVPPLFQPSKFDTGANCTTRREKWKKRL